jgi:hypothetical protein
MAGPCPTVNLLRAAGRDISADRMGKDEDKAKRLADALRENLRRRKSQARDTQPKKDPSQAASE